MLSSVTLCLCPVLARSSRLSQPRRRRCRRRPSPPINALCTEYSTVCARHSALDRQERGAWCGYFLKRHKDSRTLVVRLGQVVGYTPGLDPGRSSTQLNSTPALSGSRPSKNNINNNNNKQVVVTGKDLACEDGFLFGSVRGRRRPKGRRGQEEESGDRQELGRRLQAAAEGMQDTAPWFVSTMSCHLFIFIF